MAVLKDILSDFYIFGILIFKFFLGQIAQNRMWLFSFIISLFLTSDSSNWRKNLKVDQTQQKPDTRIQQLSIVCSFCLMLLPLWFFLRFLLCIWIFCLRVCRCTICVSGAVEARRGHQIPENWSFRWLWAWVYVVGIKPGTSGRTVSALGHWAISPAVLSL